GASVDPSQPLVEVADPAALAIVFNGTPPEAGAMHGGDSVTVKAGEGAGGESLGAGMVTTIGAAVDSVSRAVPVRARIARPARPLRIGESVFGRIVTAVHARAVTVPIEALVPAGDGYQVFVVDTAGIAHARPVTVGGRSEALAEIVTGLEAGETVVTRGAYGVADSAKIAPNTDMGYALQLVRARVNQVQATFPPDLDIEVERLTPSLFPILSYNLEGGDPATLYDIARYDIKPLISRVPGVGRVEVQGSDIREIEVVTDPARLAATGLTYTDLADDIRRAVTVQAVGRVAQDYRQYLIVTDQEARSPEDIGAVVLRNGLRVRDVATVRVGTE